MAPKLPITQSQPLINRREFIEKHLLFQVGDRFVVYKSSIPDDILEDLMVEGNFDIFRRQSYSKTSANGKNSGGGPFGQNIPRAQNIFQMSVFSCTKNNEVIFETFQ